MGTTVSKGALLSLSLLSACATARSSVHAANHGDALSSAPDGAWTYVSMPDTTCRDGSPSGLAVHRNTRSSRLLIYLEGGGVCTDPMTCAYNQANTEAVREGGLRDAGGIFDFANPRNPVRDWNVVFVPYCSGDLHAGDNRDVEVPGVGTQQFVGRRNMERFSAAMRGLMPSPSDVVLTGTSAGGLGAVLSFEPVQAAFEGVRVRLIDDSGPFFDASAHPPCLQARWRTLFGFERTVLASCGASCPHDDDFMQDYLTYVLARHADRPAGFISTFNDRVIARYLGMGMNACSAELDDAGIPEATYGQALLRLREVERARGLSTFYAPGEEHTFLQHEGFYTLRAGEAALVDWFARIAHGEPGGDFGP